ncbi:hypothetical protein [Gallaecimonas sp. GXIMD4217]|uniref:hypothetical protein n=1 Tax=Gallaecimonas sp. GXIMD4217 TaxID=3131927 RepID=UPI00311B3BF5
MKRCLHLGLSCYFALLASAMATTEEAPDRLPDASDWQVQQQQPSAPYGDFAVPNRQGAGSLFLALLPSDSRLNVSRGQGQPGNLQIRSDQLWGINSWLSGMAGVGYTRTSLEGPFPGMKAETEKYGNWRLGLFAELAGFDLELSYQQATIEPLAQDRNRVAFTISHQFSF